MSFSLRLLCLLSLPLLWAFSSSNALTGEDDWAQKIAPELWAQASNGAQVEFLVVLKEQADVSAAKRLRAKSEKGEYVFAQLRATAQRTQGAVLRVLQQAHAPAQRFFIVNAVLTRGDQQLMRRLAELPSVARLEPNPWVRMQQPIEAEEAEETLQWRSAIEWGIQRMGADQVWALGYNGQGVVIGGQDTGYDWQHPAIRNQYRGWNGDTATHHYHWHDAIRAISPLHGDTTLNPAANPCGLNIPAPCDDNNHGTHTMGTMTGDDGQGNQIGVAPGARWIACRNMERGWGTPATYIECFEWFLAPTDLDGQNPDPAMAPHVINNSWGCPPIEGCNASNWATMDLVVQNLKAAGIVVVVSAGNSGNACSTVREPAAMFEAAFAVGATRQNDTIANFSSRGPVSIDGSNRLKPDVSAPGVGVRSAIRNGGFATYSGTSMAGPHVAGLVALIISANPALAGQVDTIEQIIKQTAVPMLSPQDCGPYSGLDIPNAVYGYGRVDALAAVQRALSIVSSAQEPNDDGIRLFPNPFSRTLRLQAPALPGPLRLEVFSAAGKRLWARQWAGGQPLEEMLEWPDLPPGVYSYRLAWDGQSRSGKLIKLN